MLNIDEKLYEAAKGGNADAVAELINQGADAKAANFMGVTPLMVATLLDHPRCVEVLLPLSDPKAVDTEGLTALIMTAFTERLDCARLLVLASDADHRDNRGLTAMDHARVMGKEELLALLEAFRLAQLEARELAHVAPDGVGTVSVSRL